MKLFQKSNNILYAVIIILLISCSPKFSPKSKNNSQNSSSGKYYTSFYVNDSLTIYYIKPFELNSEKDNVTIDVTFKKNNLELNDDIVFNFSLISKEKINSKNIEKLFINDSEISTFKVLYSEPMKNKFEIRISSKIDKNLFKSLNENTILKLKIENNLKIYKPNSKSKKILNSILEFLD